MQSWHYGKGLIYYTKANISANNIFGIALALRKAHFASRIIGL